MSLARSGLEQKTTNFGFRVMFTLKISYLGISDMTQSSDFYEERCLHITIIGVNFKY